MKTIIEDHFLLSAWTALTNCLSPFLPFYLQNRCKKGKEIPNRLKERQGYPTQSRPAGSIIQFHAASVGELVSIFSVIQAIHIQDSSQSFLITTGTVTSFRILENFISHHPILARHIIHQFIPLDIPQWINRFLTYWHPSLIVLAESEIWPNLIKEACQKKIPLALINGRLSDRSLKNWKICPSLIQNILSRFQWIISQSEHDQNNFAHLQITTDYLGNLKQTAQKLHFNSQELVELENYFNNSPIWLAASTHPNEETLIAKTHAVLRKKWPNLITIIVPRHPERGQEIINEIGIVAQRSKHELPFENGLWLCDTLGELGLFYRLADIVFIGNSLDVVHKGGGHNPFEAARLNCTIATGPKIHNFRQAYYHLQKAVTIIHTIDDLTNWVDKMLSNPQLRKKQACLALEIMEQKSNLATDIGTHLLKLARQSI